jgi:hypothetical protein
LPPICAPIVGTATGPGAETTPTGLLSTSQDAGLPRGESWFWRPVGSLGQLRGRLAHRATVGRNRWAGTGTVRFRGTGYPPGGADIPITGRLRILRPDAVCGSRPSLPEFCPSATGARQSSRRCSDHACNCRCVHPWALLTLPHHRASGISFFPPPKGSGKGGRLGSWLRTGVRWGVYNLATDVLEHQESGATWRARPPISFLLFRSKPSTNQPADGLRARGSVTLLIAPLIDQLFRFGGEAEAHDGILACRRSTARFRY